MTGGTELLAQDTDRIYLVSMAVPWEVAFDRLAADDPAALELLTLMAWCGPEPVPSTLLTDHSDILPASLAATLRDPLAMARCVRVLHERAMITIDPHGIQLDRVAAAQLRARSTGHDPGRPSWSAVVVRLLHGALPADAWNNPAVWPVWQQLLPHVLAAVDTERPLDDVAHEASKLLTRAGVYQLTRGQLYEALPLFQRAYGMNRARLGDDHPDTLSAARNLAGNLRALGQHQQAYDLNQDTLGRYRRILGDDHPDTLSAANDLAFDLSMLGRYQQAYDLGQDTLTRRRRIFGDDHPDILTSANNLAADLRALGRYRQAYDLDQDTLARYRRILGDDHPETLRSATSLAYDLSALGQHRQAYGLHQDALARRRRILADHLPATPT